MSDRRSRGGPLTVSGENVTVKGLFDLMAELTGLKAPTLRAPLPILGVLAGGLELAGKLTGTRPMLDRSQVDEFAGKYAYFDSRKAERELGYTHRSARETVGRTIAWLVDRGFVTEKRRQALHLNVAAS